MNDERQIYLNRDWRPYPVKPKNHNVVGRLTQINDSNILLDCNQLFTLSHQWLERLKVGDWVSLLVADGQAIEICLLAPNLNPQANHLSFEQIGRQRKWNQFIFYVREFFEQRNFLEIQTPTLVTCPGTEPTLDVFVTEWVMGKNRKKYFLPTSPELSLKKALARGAGDIFEIKNCFRNGELSKTHLPEFYMLEWYRSFADLELIKEDVEELIIFLMDKFEISSALAFSTKTMRELFKEHLNFDLTPKTSAENLLHLACEEKIYTGPCQGFDDLFFLIFLEKIERNISSRPMFVENYPPSQAALARLTSDGWGARFEFYWQGLEIANAFYELNDPKTQRQRFHQDLERKSQLGKSEIPLDEEFLTALAGGLPPSSGIALGLDRLFMALFNIHDISQIRIF